MAWNSKMFDCENTCNNTTERFAHPNSGIVLGFSIENADKINFANGFAKIMEISGDLFIAGFFAGFKKNGDLGMWKVVLFKIAESSDDKEAVVAVVVGAAAIDFGSTDDGIGGRKTFGPAGCIEMGHLVKVAVAENVARAAVEGRNVDTKKWPAAGIVVDGGVEPFDALAFHPGLGDVNGLHDETIGEKFFIIVW